MKNLLIAISLFAAACGGSSSEDTTLITASAGGELSISGATIDIPAGALSEDTELTVSEGSISDYPALEGADNRVLEFDPPVSLSGLATIRIRPKQAIPADGSAFIRIFTDGVWITPDVSSVVIDGEIDTALPFLAPVAVVVQQPQ